LGAATVPITPPPDTYAGSGGASTIIVDPEMLLNFSKQVLSLVDGIGSDISTLFTTLKGLQLGWAGQTADEAQDYFDRLDACMTVLYGKAGDQNSGQTSLMGRIASGLDIAGNNYLAAEDAIVDLFYFTGSVSDTAIWNGHNHPTGGIPGNSPINDPNFSSISETYT
jgi:uncharacterized protein YukE